MLINTHLPIITVSFLRERLNWQYRNGKELGNWQHPKNHNTVCMAKKRLVQMLIALQLRNPALNPKCPPWFAKSQGLASLSLSVSCLPSGQSSLLIMLQPCRLAFVFLRQTKPVCTSELSDLLIPGCCLCKVLQNSACLPPSQHLDLYSHVV